MIVERSNQRGAWMIWAGSQREDLWINIFIKFFNLAGDPNRNQIKTKNQIKLKKRKKRKKPQASWWAEQVLYQLKVITALLTAPITQDIEQKFNQTEWKNRKNLNYAKAKT